MDEKELLERLRETFRVEAEERLLSMSSGLMDLEKAPDPERRRQILEVIFREAHSLKGAARSVNLTEIEELCQAMEGVFAAMKGDKIPITGGLIDLLFRCVGTVEDLSAVSRGEDHPSGTPEISTLLHLLKEAGEGKEITLPEGPAKEVPGQWGAEGLPGSQDGKHSAAPAVGEPAVTEPDRGPEHSDMPPEPLARPVAPDSVRISISSLDSIFLKAEELVSVKLSSAQRLADLKVTVRTMEEWARKWGEVEGELADLYKTAKGGNGRGRVGRFLEWHRRFVGSLREEISGLTKEAEQETRTLGLLVDDLLDEMKRATMLPFSTLLDIFPRMVREISRDRGKEAELLIEGAEVGMERRIIEEMRDPITHLLRNAVDHGLEMPDEREKRGKPRKGSIRITVSQTKGGRIEVLISDDGAGIDLAKVKEKALGQGVITEEEISKLSDQETLPLIFESGISTSPIITEISGRGLGLAIVQEKVEKLGGLISIHTVPGQGTYFRMELPVTLSTFRGVLVRVAGALFVLPSQSVERTIRVGEDEIKTVENKTAISVEGKVISLVDLAKVLNLNWDEPKGDKDPVHRVVVLAAGERRMGFRVDQVVGEQEVVLKGLGKQLRHVPNISGATILGSGRVVPVLNVKELLSPPREASLQAGGPLADRPEREKKSILLAEDSITSRMLLKNILEGAGYSVTTAVDGSEAFTTLKTGEFDLVVSDVEMPRLDGFGLTRKIRSDEKYSRIPVILVTGLETQEDRERGIDAGADAYIVKSSFNQSGLLQTVKRMI